MDQSGLFVTVLYVCIDYMSELSPGSKAWIASVVKAQSLFVLLSSRCGKT